jgi:hypothetical protein
MDLVVTDCSASCYLFYGPYFNPGYVVWRTVLKTKNLGVIWEVNIKLDREEFEYESVDHSFGSL